MTARKPTEGAILGFSGVLTWSHGRAPQVGQPCGVAASGAFLVIGFLLKVWLCEARVSGL